ncbi:MAG: hypothetical protein IJ662_10840 [Clostridia bacterium]|nr:hypothetical protein [Clostridia bacterium]
MNKLKEVLDRQLSATQWTAGDTQRVLATIQNEEPKRKKRPSIVLMAAIVTILLTTTVVLAEAQWGVLDWLFPSSTQPTVPIRTAHPVVLAGEGPEAVQIRPLEAVTDGYGLYLSVLCTPENKNTLLLNASLDPNRDPVSQIGIEGAPGGETIAAWARAQGYTAIRAIHLFSDAQAERNAQQETFDSRVSAAMRWMDDGSSVIMLAGSWLDGDAVYSLHYAVIPYEFQENDPPADGAWVLSTRFDSWETGDVSFTMQERGEQSIRILASYKPANQDAADPIQIQRVDLLQSPLASYFSVTYTLQGNADHGDMLPIFGPAMQADDSGAFRWPRLYMHGRKAQQLPDGRLEYTYFCTREIHDLPAAFELGGGSLFGTEQPAALSPRLAGSAGPVKETIHSQKKPLRPCRRRGSIGKIPGSRLNDPGIQSIDKVDALPWKACKQSFHRNINSL